MKKLSFEVLAVAMLCAAAFCGIGIAAGMTYVKWNNATTSVVETNCEESGPLWSGMFFSSENVIEQYEYDGALAVVYDDPDANILNTEIIVDVRTYAHIYVAIEKKEPLVGSLVLNEDLSRCDMKVWTFVPEPEYEMADASAKR